MSAIVLEDVRKRYLDGATRVDAVAGVRLEVPEGARATARGPTHVYVLFKI